MKRNGFTLVELLGVIIILSLLIILVMPSIIGTVKNYSKETDELTLTMIKEAAKLYIDDHKDSYPEIDGNKYCISLLDLVEGQYLKEPIKYNDEDITRLKNVQVRYDNGFDYELVDNNSCINSELET